MTPETTAVKLPRAERDMPRWVPWTIAIVAVIALAVVVVFGVTASTTRQERDATAAQAVDLASQIQGACVAGKLSKTLCDKADAVAAEPIPGPAGPAGPQGQAGVQGPQGAPGPRGEPGAKGDQGDPGAAGINGSNGADGAPGATGQQGPEGKQGPAGPTCPAGSTLLQVTYLDGRIGPGCVSDTQPTTTPPLPLIGGRP